MRINNLNKIKKNNRSKLLLSVGLAIALCAGFTMSAQAQSDVAKRQAQTGITTYYYGYKSNAVGKVNAEKRRGKYARMYYSNERRQWAVDVSNGLSTGTTTIRTKTVTTTTSADGGNLPNGANIIYFPTKASAEGIYKASLRQGDWAKMWYDSKRREWAVAVKPRL